MSIIATWRSSRARGEAQARGFLPRPALVGKGREHLHVPERLPCENGKGPCVHKKVVWLLTSRGCVSRREISARPSWPTLSDSFIRSIRTRFSVHIARHLRTLRAERTHERAEPCCYREQAIAALVDRLARIVWCCFSRFDGDPIFCSLLEVADDPTGAGLFDIELTNLPPPTPQGPPCER